MRTCHAAGVLGAPKLGDAAAWGPRIKTGVEALLNSALKGKGGMAAQGGGEFSDFEIHRAVVYLANAGRCQVRRAQGARPGRLRRELKPSRSTDQARHGGLFRSFRACGRRWKRWMAGILAAKQS